jgi:hypothetical protein
MQAAAVVRECVADTAEERQRAHSRRRHDDRDQRPIGAARGANARDERLLECGIELRPTGPKLSLNVLHSYLPKSSCRS